MYILQHNIAFKKILTQMLNIIQAKKLNTIY